MHATYTSGWRGLQDSNHQTSDYGHGRGGDLGAYARDHDTDRARP
jgi:hypothetical protein